MHVISLAESRFPGLSQIKLKTGFRDLAYHYFPNSAIFSDDEETGSPEQYHEGPRQFHPKAAWKKFLSTTMSSE
ncbi:hypothetical protein V3C99_017367 [Haemonchus contortus]